MRIVIVTQTFPPRIGGMQSVMKSITFEFSKLFKTIVFANTSGASKYLSENKNLKIFNNYAPKFLKSFLKKILIFYYANDKDIFICDSWKSVISIPKKYKKNIFVLAHGQEYLNLKKSHKIKSSLQGVSAIISNSTYTKNLVNKFITKQLDHYVVPPTYMLPDTIIKKQFTKTEEVSFISISRIEQRKGLMESLEAFNEIHKKNNKLKFRWDIVGNGPLLKSLKSYTIKNNLSSFIFFHQNISDEQKDKLFRNSNIFIMPSYRFKKSVEGFGIVYAEAARYGIPSIAGKDGGVSDIIFNDINGWNVHAKDIKFLKKIILFAINNPKDLFFKGKIAQKIYLDKFSKKNSFSLLLNIIQNKK
jgi:phosphatidylinositol alpha-1,6-mannosyltransferase